MKPQNLLDLADALEKVAEYIEVIETENAGLVEKSASAVEPEQPPKAKNELHEKLASIGFTEDEIQIMDQSMPETMITKVASISEQPWGLGQAAGPKREKTDPLMEWLIN